MRSINPQPDKKSQKELAITKVVLVFLALIALVFVVWLAWIRPAEKSADITSFDECVAAGNPVQLSYPGVCVTPDGQRFTNE